MIDVATGAPDWQGLRWKVEAVTRPNLAYPTGRVEFIDEFNEPNFHWSLTQDNGATVTLTTANAFDGVAAAKLSIAATAGSDARLTKSMGLFEAEKVGIELRHTLPAIGGNQGVLYIIIDWYDGATWKRAQISRAATANGWSYLTTGGALVEIDATRPKLGDTVWHHVKMIADLATNEYTQLRFNETATDLTGKQLYSAASSSSPELQITIQFYRSTTGTACSAYVDSVLITNEG